MEFQYSKNKIVFNRELADLDKMVLRFVKTMDRCRVKYVIISGYVAILFGRSRNTEDVDLFVEKMDLEKLKEWWVELAREGFQCINASNPESALHDYLVRETAIRFAENGKVIPNFEVKFPKSPYNIYSIQHPVEVLLQGNTIWTSEMELQIAFKLYLGSEKDYEDARHLFNLFQPHLNIGLLQQHITKLGQERTAEEILWKKGSRN